jgi:transglutaminase-like putative cysteine protease
MVRSVMNFNTSSFRSGLEAMATSLLGLVPFIVLILLVGSLDVSARTFSLPKTPPLGERWFGIYLNDERTGFARVGIDEIPDGYRIQSESAVKMSGLGFSRESTIREYYVVNKDLSLRSLQVSQTIDGKRMKLTGESRDRGIRITIESDGTRKERILTKNGPIYPPAVLNLYPLFHGAAAGKKYLVSMLDVEAVKVKDVRFTVIGFEKVSGVETIHLRNNQYPVVDNDIWLDSAGNTLKESVRDGWIETRSEDAGSARRFLADAALSRKEMILDFSLIPVDMSIARAKELRRLVVEVSGFPEHLPLLSGLVQKGERTVGDKVHFTVDLSLARQQVKAPPEEAQDLKPYLASSDRILPEHPEIVRRKTEILNGVTDPFMIIEKLSSWVAGYLEESTEDRLSPLETLKARSGNSQAHARLYASLARSAGIPTRFVSGIVYVSGKGFLYHSWAESYVGYWLPVDPVSGQTPADATHIKLAEGDSEGDIGALAGVIGSISARILQQDY